MFDKKAQGLTLNAVIIAILVLLVLVVLSLIFLRATSDVRTSTQACENKGGQCMPWDRCDTDNFDRIISGVNCPGDDGEVGTPDDDICCVKG